MCSKVSGMSRDAWVLSAGKVTYCENLEMISFGLDTPKLNCWTCQWMYKRKASLGNLQINMMVNFGIPEKYIAIAALDLMVGMGANFACLVSEDIFANETDYSMKTIQ
jgi:hypothetical protein